MPDPKHPSPASPGPSADPDRPNGFAMTMPIPGPPEHGGEVVDETIIDALDHEAIATLLESHAQLANVRLSVLNADGRPLFEAAPSSPSEGEMHEVPLEVPDSEPLRLCGPLPEAALARVADVIGRSARDRNTSSVRLAALDAERQRLSLVFDFSEKVCQLAAFEEVVTTFLGDVARILQAQEATFFAVDARAQELYIRCHHGSRPEVVRDFRLKIGEGIAGSVARDLMPRIVNNVDNCPDYVPGINPIRNIIVAPVVVRGQLIGVINVNDRIAGLRPFSNRDLQLLVSLARLGGVALDNARLYEEVRQLLLSTVESLTSAIDAKDQFALGHSKRVSFLCSLMGRRLKLPEEERDLLRIAAMLHDIGNLAIPESVLSKPGPLDERERALIRQHPDMGASILSPVAQLSAVLPGIVDHHERYDGRGYPRHLKGEDISLQGRLIAIADSFDAMTHDRPFRACCSAQEAIGEITSASGTQFDPSLVGVFGECFRELELDRVSLDDLVPPGPADLDF